MQEKISVKICALDALQSQVSQERDYSEGRALDLRSSVFSCKVKGGRNSKQQFRYFRHQSSVALTKPASDQVQSNQGCYIRYSVSFAEVQN